MERSVAWAAGAQRPTGGEPLTIPAPGEAMASGAPPAIGEDDRWAAKSLELITRARSVSGRLPGRWDRRVRELGKAIVNYRGARSAYVRQALFAVLGRGSDVLMAPFGEGRLLVPADDQEIGRVVFATGGYERLYMASAVDELRRRGFPVEGTTFVDVGANIGTSTVDALLTFGFARALCFEPDERSFRLLLANVAVNGLNSRVQAYRVALSATAGASILHLSPTNRADNRLVGQAELNDVDHRRLVDVELVTFDDMAAAGDIDPDEVGLLWLDAQGHEPFVLEGAGRALEAGIPLVMEYTPAALRETDSLDALEQLVEAHYTTVIDLHLMAAGLRSRAVIAAVDMHTLRNLDREHTDLLVVRTTDSHR